MFALHMYVVLESPAQWEGRRVKVSQALFLLISLFKKHTSFSLCIKLQSTFYILANQRFLVQI